MAYITGKIPQGCCLPVKYLGDNTFQCEPDVGEFHRKHKIYNDYHLFYAKIIGKKDEKITIKIKWPQFDANKVSQEYKEWSSYSADWISFFYAVHEVCYISTDQKNWTNIKNAVLEDDCIVFSLNLPADECYISTTLYYTEAMFEDLIKTVAFSPYVKVENIGKGWDGSDLLAFTATDFSVPVSEKKTVYLQGAQHCHERTGCHVCDYMLRFLTSGSDEAKNMLKRCIFRFVPIVDITGWRSGCSVHPERKASMDFNYNRDWGVFNVPETLLITEYLNKAKLSGESFEFLADLHGGTGDERDYSSGAGVNIDDRDSKEIINRKIKFVNFMKQNCDFIKPEDEGYNCHRQHENMFAVYTQKNFGTSFTFEISQSKIWDREAGRRFPNSQFAFKRFAEQLIKVIDKFVSEE